MFAGVFALVLWPVVGALRIGSDRPAFATACAPFPNKRVVLLSLSASYADFLRNWFTTSSKYLTDDDVVVVAAEDDEALRLVTDATTAQQIGRAYTVMDSTGRLLHNETEPKKVSFLSWSEEEDLRYRVVTGAKPSRMLSLLEQGCTVYWSDIDAVWTKSVWDDVASLGVHDLYVPDDSGDESWTVLDEEGNWNLCTCQMYIQPTDAVKNMFSRWVSLITPDADSDQVIFNEVMKKDQFGNKTVDLAVLPFSKFPPGPATEAQHNPTVVHANWLSEAEDKTEFLRKFNLWSLS